ncbi:MAG: metallophosphoesterase family protein [Planctomycetota bacterium]
MLHAIFSDIHSNLPALDAVLAEADARHADSLLCLGDLVGYGPHPCEVIDRVRSLDCPVVAGNHDRAAVELLDSSCFNVCARRAIEWTARRLDADRKQYLARLPLTLEDGGISAVHGTRDEPEEFLYLKTTQEAGVLMRSQRQFLEVFGHTHVPLSFLRQNGGTTRSFSRDLDLREVDRALVNVGSVGQPRDEDTRATFVLFDDERRHLEICRVPYDIERVSAEIIAAGLPALLSERLRFGF